MNQQATLAHGQSIVNSGCGVTQLQLPFQLGSSGTALSAVAPGGVAGMTSLYGKLRTQAVPAAAAVSAQAADAQLLAASGSAASSGLHAASSVGTTGYGWQGQKAAAASAISSDGSSILQPQLASRLVPLQHSLFSKSATTGSHTSSISIRSTSSSLVTPDQAHAGSFPATATQPVPALEAPATSAAAGAAAGGVPGAYSDLLDALGLSGASSGSAQDEQAMLSLLMSAQSSSMCAAPRAVSTSGPADFGSSIGGSAQLLLTPPTVSTAEELSSRRLLQQLQQMYVNESAAAQSYQSHAQGAHALTCNAMGNHSGAASIRRAGTPISIVSDIGDVRQQRVLMLRLQQLQESQARHSQLQAAGPGSCGMLGCLDTASAAAMPQAFFSGQYAGNSYATNLGAEPSAFCYQQMPAPMPSPSAPAGATPVILQLNTQQQPSQLTISQLLTQLGSGAVCRGSAVPGSSMSAQHGQCVIGAAGMSMPNAPAGPASVNAAIEQFQHNLLMGSSGMAATVPLPGHGVFGSLAGLAAAGAAVIGACGMLPAGKHTLQVGPGHNPMYKTELCHTWLETGGCRYGARCQFAHGAHELRAIQRHPKYKTQPCRTFSTQGFCPYGDRCNFIHDQQLQVAKPRLQLQDNDSITSTNSGGEVSKAGGVLEPTFSLN